MDVEMCFNSMDIMREEINRDLEKMQVLIDAQAAQIKKLIAEVQKLQRNSGTFTETVEWGG